MPKLRPAHKGQLQAARDAVNALRDARTSNSPKALAAINRAIKSAEGNARHAAHRQSRPETDGQAAKTNCKVTHDHLPHNT
jgi:hypothetical protein